MNRCNKTIPNQSLIKKTRIISKKGFGSIREFSSGLIRENGRGFTLLFAVLVGSILFSMGIAVANVAVKEIVLSASAKHSAEAFYAADGGAECALYWDLREPGTFPQTGSSPRPRVSIVCGGVTVSLEFSSGASTAFSVPFYSSCTEVLVIKGASGGGGDTIIESRGRNICGSGDNPARAERALRVRY